MSERWDLGELAGTPILEGKNWEELIRTSDLSAGVYRLEAGGVDRQLPHREDEIYVVISGQAVLRVENEIFQATPGTAIFVPAQAVHRFEEISADLTLFVIFAPPESSAD